MKNSTDSTYKDKHKTACPKCGGVNVYDIYGVITGEPGPDTQCIDCGLYFERDFPL
jgi:hypothetical protein